jgi:hypothetical protein
MFSIACTEIDAAPISLLQLFSNCRPSIALRRQGHTLESCRVRHLKLGRHVCRRCPAAITRRSAPCGDRESGFRRHRTQPDIAVTADVNK